MFKLTGYLSRVLAVACGILALNPSDVFGQKTDARAPDETALRQASKEYSAAVQRNNPKALAEFWTSDGVYIDENGQSYKVRDLLVTAPDAKAAVRPPTKLTSSTIRFLTPDSATEDGTSEVTPAGKSSPVKGRFSAVWVRQSGKWKLNSLREFRIGTEAPAPVDRLSGLEPFLGKWSGQTASHTMHVTAEWNPAKSFLRRDISVASGGKVVFTATQQVGWDPARQQIRSWVFDGDGGYGEGLWSLEGNVWMVLAQGMHPDGKRSSATHIFKFIDRNTLVWKSIHGSRDAQPIADVEITLTHGDKPLPARGAPATSPTGSTEAAKKAALLASDSWRHIEAEYKEWASVQILYTPQQMEQTRVKLAAEIEKMSAADLQQFIAEVDGKLKLLLNKDAMEARAWLGQYLSVFTDGYRQYFIGNVPNFADMTSAQIEEEYLRLKAKVMARQRNQASFDASRTEVADARMKADAAAQRAAIQLENTMNSPGNNNNNLYQSHYNPRPEGRLPPPQMQFTERVGNLYYSLPGSSF